MDAGLITGAQRRWATSALMLATALQAADATIVNVALPQLQRDLGGGVWLGAWVMTSYLCAAAVVAPLTGWLRRRFGPRRVYGVAIGLFVVASLLCAIAPSAAAIILFRALQGAGGGVIPALSQAVLHDLHPRPRHGRILAIWGAVAMLGPILGPALGGAITDLASWRCVFLINLPLGALALWGTGVGIAQGEPQRGDPIDALGLVLLIAGIGTLQLWLSRAVGHSSVGSLELMTEAAIAALALGATLLRARRSAHAILRLEVFRDRNFAAAAFLNFLTSALLFTSIVFVPALVQGPLGRPATIAGLTMVPRGVLMMLVILGVGQLLGKFDFRVFVTAGSLIAAAGLGLLAYDTDRIAWLILGSTVQAVGAGTILMPLSTFAFTSLPGDLRTDAAGLYSLLRQIGCASGIALMSGVLQAEIAARLPGAGATLAGYAACFGLMALAALAGLPVILLFRAGRHDGSAESAMPAD